MLNLLNIDSGKKSDSRNLNEQFENEMSGLMHNRNLSTNDLGNKTMTGSYQVKPKLERSKNRVRFIINQSVEQKPGLVGDDTAINNNINNINEEENYEDNEPKM